MKTYAYLTQFYNYGQKDYTIQDVKQMHIQLLNIINNSP